MSLLSSPTPFGAATAARHRLPLPAWEGVEWEGEPLGFEVSTEPMPYLPDPEKPDFWEGPNMEVLGFFVQYMWAFGVFFSVSTSSSSITSRCSTVL
uniref:Uncharacterized protein n=1 Tax=Aegilops tauschii subsp. strangulata TaxID=200361 RepID=A0A453H705_AEGTS